MAWNIAFFTGYDPVTRQCYGKLISSLAPTPSGSSADAGAVPANASVARITSDAAGYISNNGTAASSGNGVSLAAGCTIDMQVNSADGLKIA